MSCLANPVPTPLQQLLVSTMMSFLDSSNVVLVSEDVFDSALALLTDVMQCGGESEATSVCPYATVEWAPRLEEPPAPHSLILDLAGEYARVNGSEDSRWCWIQQCIFFFFSFKVFEQVQ